MEDDSLKVNWQIETPTPTRQLRGDSRELLNGLLGSLVTSPDSSSMFWQDIPHDEEQQQQEVEPLEIHHREAYEIFLDQMRLQGAIGVVRKLKLFIVGIQLEKSEFPDQVFVFDSRITEFFEEMKYVIAAHPFWNTETQIQGAIEGVEKYVLLKLEKYVFGVNPEEFDMNSKVTKRFKILQAIVTPDHLEVPEACRNELVLSLVQEELRRMNQVVAPVDKVDCIVRAISIIFNTMSISSRSKRSAGFGADDFIPVFFYAVLFANIPKLWCNIEYIRKFRNRDALLSESGCCFSHLRSAVEFFMKADASSFKSMKDSEFIGLN